MNYNEPLISVIVPFYNVRPYLYKCLESIKNQTYKNIEVLMIDNRSNDGSDLIAKQFEKLDNRFKYRYKDDCNRGGCRTYGVKISQGAFISFIDSDDWIDKNFLKALFCFLKNNELDLAICSFYYSSKNVNRSSNPETKKVIILDKYSFWDNYFFATNNIEKIFLPMIPVWCKLYKKDILVNIQMKDVVYQDQHFTTAVVDNCKKIGFFNKELYYYNNPRPESIMAQMQKRDIYYYVLIYLKDRIKFFKTHNYPKRLISFCNNEKEKYDYMLIEEDINNLIKNKRRFNSIRIFQKSIVLIVKHFSLKTIKTFLKVNFRHFLHTKL